MSAEATRTQPQPDDRTKDSTTRACTGCTSWLIISVVVLTVTTAFIFGWGLGAPNMYNDFTEPFLRGKDPCLVAENKAQETTIAPSVSDNQNAEGRTEETGEQKSAPSPAKEKFSFGGEAIKGIPQTIFLIGAFIGAVTGPFWVNLFDRKRTVFANYIFCFASSLCVLLASYLNQPWLFYLSRLLLGYQGGMACAVVPPFLNEIAPQSVRGAAGAGFQLSLTLGILIGQVVGLPFIAGSCTGWGWGLSIVFLLPLAGIFLLFLIPNSPVQMIGKYNDEAQATSDLQKLRGTNNVQDELQKIIEESRQTSGGGKKELLSIPQVLKSERYRWPMLTTVALQLGQALCGINAVFFYSSKMFAKAGIPSSAIPYANIGTGAINVLATIVTIYLIEKLGRKKLIIYPMGVMCIVFFFLTILVNVNEKRSSTALGVLAVILILIFIVCFAVGLGPIPYLYGSEVTRPEARDSVQSLGLVANYLGNILVSLFFPALNSALGGYVFLIFLVFVGAHVAFLWFKMPETQNKNIADVEKFWKINDLPPTATELLPKGPVSA